MRRLTAEQHLARAIELFRTTNEADPPRWRRPTGHPDPAVLRRELFRRELERALETGRRVAASRRWICAAIEPRLPWREAWPT